jgi:hypothetical protein
MFVYSAAYAGQCEIQVTRIPCPGQEAECLKKCEGKAKCTPDDKNCCVDIKKKVSSPEACVQEALKNCPSFRPGVTRAKKISAIYDGKPLDGGKDYCSPEKPEFNWGTCK